MEASTWSRSLSASGLSSPGIATTSRLGCRPSDVASSSLLLTCGGWGRAVPRAPQACCGPGRCEEAGEAEEKTVRLVGNW